MGLFDVFKDKDDEDDKGGTEEINFESLKNQDNSSESEPEPQQETTTYSPPAEETPSYSSSQTESQIGIGALMDKRVKLEEAIDYVGLMIKNL